MPILDGAPVSETTPCASVLKPIYAWLAYGMPSWEPLMKASVSNSDNEATDTIVNWLGGPACLREILCEIHLVQPAATWGRFLVSASSVRAYYTALQSANDTASRLVIQAMENTSPKQRFCVPSGQGVKAGWDLQVVHESHRLVTNLVVLEGEAIHAYVGSSPAGATTVQAWQQALAVEGPEGVLPFHYANAPHIPYLNTKRAQSASQ